MLDHLLYGLAAECFVMLVIPQEVENRINILRKKIGKKPSVRVSMLITPEDEILFEEGRILIPTESEHSSLSDGKVNINRHELVFLAAY